MFYGTGREEGSCLGSEEDEAEQALGKQFLERRGVYLRYKADKSHWCEAEPKSWFQSVAV